MSGSGGRGRNAAIIHAGKLVSMMRGPHVYAWCMSSHTKRAEKAQAEEQYLAVLTAEEQGSERFVERGSFPSTETRCASSVLSKAGSEGLTYGPPKRRRERVERLFYYSFGYRQRSGIRHAFTRAIARSVNGEREVALGRCLRPSAGRSGQS